MPHLFDAVVAWDHASVREGKKKKKKGAKASSQHGHKKNCPFHKPDLHGCTIVIASAQLMELLPNVTSHRWGQRDRPLKSSSRRQL